MAGETEPEKPPTGHCAGGGSGQRRGCVPGDQLVEVGPAEREGPHRDDEGHCDDQQGAKPRRGFRGQPGL